MRPDGIATRIVVASLLVAGVVMLVLLVGVMRIGSDTFMELMHSIGESAEEAGSMFQSSLAGVAAVAAIVAALAAVVLGSFLARRIARPIERLAEAAQRTAQGDLRATAPVEGPTEVRALANAFNVMVDRLAEQDAVRREFVVNASHELRTPLTNLQGYLEALRDGVLPPDPATFESLKEEVDRLTRLASSLDALAGADDERPMPEDVDLGALVRNAVELVTPSFARRSINVGAAIAPGIVVHARADELAQVVSNLLQNALRYTPAGGEVRVAVLRDDGHATVRVANSGSKIPADDLPRVWERFFRVERSRDRASGGAGIGLAIVKRLVEEAGGRVGATSEAGVTTFWFSLPS
ncbi:MAG TPA: HAMP domain-containing sensor histidine kinase [Candidatus Limnocylindria bacterium]|nr:HAMP domain-containing sensor histidine kinase [Candidatus Limnocylindria bacterium]